MLMQLEIIQRQIKNLSQQRDQELNDHVSSIEAENRQQVLAFQRFETQKNRLESRLAEIENELETTSAVPAPEKKVIEHLPSPIAKTVFSNETHVLVSQGRLTLVPMDALIDRMKSEWKVKAEKLETTYRTVETAGPIDGFRIQYELVRETEHQSTKVGLVKRDRVNFRQFQLIPDPSNRGVELAAAFQEGSKFKELLARFEPRTTTVSIWVYPDSFQQHNQLKTWLHEQGFQIASWPMDFGKRISGGPNGFKTSAQ